MTLRSSFVLLLVISTTWLFGLLAVNNSVLAFHYFYTVLCSLQVTAQPLLGRARVSPVEDPCGPHGHLWRMGALC